MVAVLAQHLAQTPQQQGTYEKFVNLPNARQRILQKQWTYEDDLHLPDDGSRYEIIEGVLYVSNAHDIVHQLTVGEIHFQLKLFLRENPVGYVLTAPFEVHLSETTRPVQPDVLFIRAYRWPTPGAKYFEGAPYLVVEVLSPSTRRLDQSVKFHAYEKAKVSEYWMVDPKAHLVQVFSLDDPEYVLVGEFMNDDMIESRVLADLKIMASSLFNK